MLILVDMDGVTCHFVPAVCREYRLATGKNLMPEDVTDWVMGKFGIEREMWQKPGFFRSLEPIKGAIEVLWLLHQNGHKIWIVTDAMGVNFVEKEKAQWVKEHLPFVKGIVFTSEKDKIPGDIIIEDAPHHLEKHPATTIKMKTPYNEGVLADHEVEGWDEIKALLA